MDGKLINGSFVWAGRHPRDFGVISAEVSFGISDNYVPHPGERVRKAFLHVLSINQLVLAVYVPEVRGREWPTPPLKQWVQLWPSWADIEYYPMESVDEDSLNRFLKDHRSWLPLLGINRFQPYTATAVPNPVD
jgi:hypothetical protein